MTPFQARKSRADPVVVADDLTPNTHEPQESPAIQATTKRRRFASQNSNYTSVTGQRVPPKVKPALCPFVASSATSTKSPGPPPPEAPFMAHSPLSQHPANHHVSRDEHGAHKIYEEVYRKSPPPSSVSRSHPNAAEFAFYRHTQTDPAASPSTVPPGRPTAIANPTIRPRTIPPRSSICHDPPADYNDRLVQHIDAVSDDDRLNRPNPRNLSSQTRGRIPRAPSPTRSFAKDECSIPGAKPSGRKSSDNLDVVCLDTEEALSAREGAVRRKPQPKKTNKRLRDATGTAPKSRSIGLRSVPISDFSNVSLPRSNGVLPESQPSQKKHRTTTRSKVKVPGLKSTAEKNVNSSVNDEEGNEQPPRVRVEQSREQETVDVDGPDSAEAEKRTPCRPTSVEQKFVKRESHRAIARSEVERCLKRGSSVIELAFLNLVDTDLCKIASIGFTEVPNIKRGANLSYNCLTKLSDSVSKWFVRLNLLSLNLQGNSLQIIRGLSELTILRELDLSDNQLGDIPNDIAMLSNLEMLSVKNNLLTDLPKGLWKLKCLKTCDVSGNELSTLPEDFAREGSILSSLDISYNPSFDAFPACVEHLTKMEDLLMSGTPVEKEKVKSDNKLTAAELLNAVAGMDSKALRRRKEERRRGRSRVTGTEEIEPLFEGSL